MYCASLYMKPWCMYMHVRVYIHVCVCERVCVLCVGVRMYMYVCAAGGRSDSVSLWRAGVYQ